SHHTFAQVSPSEAAAFAQPPDLGGIRRNAHTRSRRLVPRRSQGQIPLPALPVLKGPGDRACCFRVNVCRRGGRHPLSNFARRMTPSDRSPPRGRGSLVERRVQRIVNARSVTVGLAGTLVGVAVVGGIVIRFTDSHNFSSVGLGIWWALQTVTTVGYGDVVPTTVAGRIVGSVEMVLGVAFIAFVTAGVTSALIRRSEAEVEKAERERS